MTQTKHTLAIDGLLALMTAILCTCFNAAYITYFYILAALLLGLVQFKYKLPARAPGLSADDKWIFLSVALCYGGAFISSAALWDEKSALVTAKMLSFTFSMVIIWWVGKKYDVYPGVKYGVYIGAAINILGGILQYAKVPLFRPILDPERLQGLFGGPNTTGMVISYTIPLLCWYGFTAKGWKEKAIALALIAGNVVCLVKTGSRDAMGGLAVGILLAPAFFGLRNLGFLKAGWKRSGKLLAGVLVSVLLLLGVLGASMAKENMGRSGGERAQMLTASMAMWQDHKVFGVGMARWAEYYQKKEYHPEGVREANVHPHNVPVLFLSTTGVVGCACYLLSALAIFLNLFKGLKYKGDREGAFSMPIMAVFLAFAAEGIFDSTLWWKEPTAITFWILGTYLAVHRWIRK